MEGREGQGDAQCPGYLSGFISLGKGNPKSASVLCITEFPQQWGQTHLSHKGELN